MRIADARIFAASFVVAAVLLGGGLTGTASAATGDVLTQFVAPVSGLARGLAFDGTLLYYTLVGDFQIHKVTTAGAAAGDITLVGGQSQGGPLAWDGLHLWTIDYNFGSFVLLQIDPPSGNVAYSCDIATANPGHPAVTSAPNVGEYPDGLDWTGSQLVLSSEIGPTPNWVVFVDPACKISSAFNPLVHNGYGPSGVAFDGLNLWHSYPDATNLLNHQMIQTTAAVVETGLSFQVQSGAEDLAYDAVTFAPKCALWGYSPLDNTITAYEVPCGSGPTPSRKQTWGSIKARYR